MSAETTRTRTLAAGRPQGFVVDRIIVGILLLITAIGAAAVFLAALGLFRLADVLPEAGPALEDAVLMRSLPMGLGRVAAGASAAVIGLLAIVLLLRRIVPTASRKATDHHVLSADDLGLVLIDKRGVSAVAEAAVERVPGVVQVNVRVLGGGTSAVRLVAQTWAHTGADLRRLGDEAREQARQAVEQLVGLDVHDVLVRLHVVPMEDLDRVVE